MNRKMKFFVLLTAAVVLLSASAVASGNVSINVVNAGSSSNDWQSTATTVAEGVNWNIKVNSISNHGVGRVWNADTWDYGSGLYTYGPSSTGTRPAKKYDGVVHGDNIVWRMRADNDYTTAFSCSGTFYP